MVQTTDALVLAASGLLAGSMNAMAGGGSFVSFPALIGVGVPPVAANASSAVALYPGGVASAWVYRGRAGPVAAVPLPLLGTATAIGGLLGAVLLLATPPAAFDRLVPWLLLAATLALAFPRTADFPTRGISSSGGILLAGQFGLGIYGGYFGGAAGLMMVAFWTFIAGVEAKSVQAQRTLLVTVANSAAVLLFAAIGVVRWDLILIVMPAGIAGGYAGALLGRRLRAAHVRSATICISAVVTLAFFVRAYS